MTHNTNKNLSRLHSLLLTFFGDETLHFHSTRLSNFFNAAFPNAQFNDEETDTPNIPHLLHYQNNLQRLLDAAHLLHQHFTYHIKPNHTCVFTQLQHIYPLLKDWNDFPSHLHPHEWCNPETVLEEFFNFQSIDDWKNTVNGLLESALNERPLIATLSEKQIGFIIHLLHRLQDAVWLLYVTGRIPGLKTTTTTTANQELYPHSLTNKKTITHPFFFFITSSRKFVRVDLNNILCTVSMDDHVFLHTTTGSYKPVLTHDQLKELLPETQFTWINECIAVRRNITNLSVPYRLPAFPA